MRSQINLAIAVGASLALAACGSNPRLSSISRPTPRPGAPVSDWPVKVGNPYQVLGQWYYPKDDANYNETGIASWYGPKFHGLSTANGEAYDMETLSAAHKTLPLPSYVEVTNLDNGRRLIVRVNDRGPFVNGRIIDLSRKAAEMLDVERPGTARVRVRRIYPPEDVRLALRSGRGARNRTELAMAETGPAAPVNIPAVPVQRTVATPAASPAPPAPVHAATRPAPIGASNEYASKVALVSLPPSNSLPSSNPDASAPAAMTAEAVPVPQAAPSSSPATSLSFIQVAAVSDSGRASWLADYLKSFGTPVIQPTGTGLIRVRIGPYSSAAEAQAALAKLRDAGYQDARIVYDGLNG